MPRYRSYYGGDRSIGLSGAVSGFLGSYMEQKRRKEDERQQLIIEALRQQQFDATQASNLFRREQAARDRNAPKLVGSPTAGYKNIFPGQTNVAGQQISGMVQDVTGPFAEEDPALFQKSNIKGQGYTFNPNTGEWELKVEDKTKKKAGPKLSSEEWKLFNEIYKNVSNPNLDAYYGKDPFQLFDFARRRLGVTSGPKVEPRRSSVRDEPIGADPGLITPGQGFQQGQQGAQAISLPPELQNDPEVLMIVEDYKNGTLTYEDANDLISQKVAELQGQ